jgi:UDP-N-acetylmuramoyl-tripeptide--D-alanyl-D-alanine ligase
LAAAVGAELGLSQLEIQRGLAACKPVKMRLQRWEWNGVLVLDDTYNANADSMRAALETLRDLPCAGRRVAVLGDMAELGGHSLAAHSEVGRMTAEFGVEQLFTIGAMGELMAESARAAGTPSVAAFPDVPSAGEAVRLFLKTGDVMLMKASRATRLEELSAILKGGTPVKRD